MYKVREEREYISQLNCEQLRYFFYLHYIYSLCGMSKNKNCTWRMGQRWE